MGCTVSRVTVSKRAAPRLKTPKARAWRRYHRTTKDLRGLIYEDTEPWAWQELQNRLVKIQQIEDEDGA